MLKALSLQSHGHFSSPDTLDLWLVSKMEITHGMHLQLSYVHSGTIKLAIVTHLRGRSLRLRLFRNWEQKSQFLGVNAVLYTLQCSKLHICQLQ